MPTSYAATIEEMCASPENSMGFIPGLGYVLANQLCGVDVAYKAVRFGNDVYWAQILVRDGDIQSLADLNGKKWAIPTPVRPRATWPFCPSLRKTASSRARRWKPAVTPARVRTVYNGEPTSPRPSSVAAQARGRGTLEVRRRARHSGRSHRQLRTQRGRLKLMCGDWRVLDARASLEEAPDVVQKVKILALARHSQRHALLLARLPRRAAPRSWARWPPSPGRHVEMKSIGNQDYGWTGINPATDAEYDVVRADRTSGADVGGLG
ncbi:MAG: PhnD/SsuA/transferrin family substrate-binding protein [Caldilineaceae bacterium]